MDGKPPESRCANIYIYIYIYIFTNMPAPHTLSRQLPSQIRQIPVTSDHTVSESIHPLVREASGLSVCTVQSHACLRSSPRCSASPLTSSPADVPQWHCWKNEKSQGTESDSHLHLTFLVVPASPVRLCSRKKDSLTTFIGEIQRHHRKDFVEKILSQIPTRFSHKSHADRVRSCRFPRNLHLQIRRSFFYAPQ